MTQTPRPANASPTLDREKLADAILSSSLDCIIVADVQGRIVEFNAAAERTFGWSRSDILGKTMDDTIVPHHHRAAHRQGMTRYLAGGAPRVIGRRVEIEGLHALGHTFPVELSITETIMDGARFFVATLRDISLQKAAADDLLRTRASLQAIFDNVPVGIHINRIGPGGVNDQTVEFANDNMGRPYGVTGAGLIGRDVYDFYRSHGVMEEDQAFDRDILASGRPGRHEGINALSGRYESYPRFPIMNAAGKITHMGASVSTLTPKCVRNWN